MKKQLFITISTVFFLLCTEHNPFMAAEIDFPLSQTDDVTQAIEGKPQHL